MDDLDPLMQSWPFEPGPMKARTIQGSDGREKIQLRLDLGILQMESAGRPDGQRPFGCESLLDHYEKIARRFEKEDQTRSFKLTMEDCLKLQQEGIQYYHRYLAFFQLHNLEGVIQDTRRNLRLFDFVSHYCERPEMVTMFQQFRPYVVMMRTRAQGGIALDAKDYVLAIRHVQAGIQEIRGFLAEHFPPDWSEHCAELQFLENWLEEIRKEQPLTPREKLHQQMLKAIEQEDYERAARLRDALRELE